MYVLGLNSVFHESAACLLCDGEIVAFAEEERFSRHKHGKPALPDNPEELPIHAMTYCLQKEGLTPEEVDHIGYSFQPSLRAEAKFESSLVVEGSWGSLSGERSFLSHLQSVPEELEKLGFKEAQFHWLPHHRCHGASAFFVSPFDEAAILIADGIGEFHSTLIAHGEGHRMRNLRSDRYPHSIGFLWEKLSKFLGFSEYDASKIMGLSAFGRPTRYAEEFENLVHILPEGRFTMDESLLRFRLEDYAPLENLFQMKRRQKGGALLNEHKDIAAALQATTTVLMHQLTLAAHEMTGSDSLCLAGGVALNCVSNYEVHCDGPFQNFYVQPAAHDAGTALGAALLVWNEQLGQEHRFQMDNVYFGPSFSDEGIDKAIREFDLNAEVIDDLEEHVASVIASGLTVGWFQGAMEVGPRALGNRSLLADPRREDMVTTLNQNIKKREDFRPFGASVAYERIAQWFDLKKPTPAVEYMLMACPVWEHQRTKIPAVVHVDGTCRIQAVRAEGNPRYHRLLQEFEKQTGVPMILNTSFNCEEPIVCSPGDAIRTYLNSNIDYLVLGDRVVSRRR